MATPVDSWCEAGTHELRFDGAGLPTGCYSYQLEADGKSARRTFVVLR
jgi:hypothetical protein